MSSTNSNDGNSRPTADKPSAPVFGPERPPHGPASQAAADATQAAKEREDRAYRGEDPLCAAIRAGIAAGYLGPEGFSVGV
ncbi:uncharacterized protein FTOL_07664 [Fusarium torulosum]|uniref:Uncharacterized protein n=1 Tax=Fusarium torulosum TaxID=33205 RepID=A0AAE8MCD8_9HYPO|nr:uncharacterized protein FTOL_07664 [Fusarium torulosum]